MKEEFKIGRKPDKFIKGRQRRESDLVRKKAKGKRNLKKAKGKRIFEKAKGKRYSLEVDGERKDNFSEEEGKRENN